MRTRPSPLCVRLTPAERELLERAAAIVDPRPRGRLSRFVRAAVVRSAQRYLARAAHEQQQDTTTGAR